MSETHVVSALRKKRAEVAGHVNDLEKRVKTWRARLAHIDETIKIFSPHTDPEAIPAKRTIVVPGISAVASLRGSVWMNCGRRRGHSQPLRSLLA
jgi:hypothetical protein